MSPCKFTLFLLRILGNQHPKFVEGLIQRDKPSRAKVHPQDSVKMTCDGMQVQGMHQEYNRRDVGLLHPDWRKFPHVQLYGWTAHHERQWKYLHNMIVKGALESAYYATEKQYEAASLSNRYAVLSRPIVSSVKEVIELLRRNQQFGNYSQSLAEAAEYDADDESDEKPGSRCRQQNYRRLETAV